MYLTAIPSVRVDRKSRATVWAFATIAFSTIFLQKLGVPVPGTAGNVGLGVVVLWLVVLGLAMYGEISIDPMRAALFAGLISSVMLCLILERGITSTPAVIVFMALYGTLLFTIKVDEDTMLRCVDKYQICMVIIAFIVIGQQIIQLSIGNEYWPNLEKVIPHDMLITGFAYMRPYTYDSAFLTPNGIFFLEPSSLSLCLAVAVAVEIVWFKRLPRIALFAGALFGLMAGTGITVIALLSPWLLRKMDRRLFKWSVGLGAPLLLIATALGAFSLLSSRSAEFSESNSSGYGRMVAPMFATIALLMDPSYLVSGSGPGTSSKMSMAWPANKLMYEYGLVTAFLFHAYLFVAVIRWAISRLVMMVSLIPMLFFGGGFLSVTDTMLLIMYGSLLRLKPTQDHANMATLTVRKAS